MAHFVNFAFSGATSLLVNAARPDARLCGAEERAQRLGVGAQTFGDGLGCLRVWS